MGKRQTSLAVLLILTLFLSGCVVQKSPITGDRRAYGYSWEKEKQIGRQADQQIQQQYGIYQDEQLLSYVKNLGEEILSVSHMRREDTPEQYKNTEFTFRVLDSPV
ncbi:MAG: peptidase M48, partial [Balneolaceae bacterium]|nr:peptidase M48 [Balneolaceae bacterium]